MFGKEKDDLCLSNTYPIVMVYVNINLKACKTSVDPDLEEME